MNTLQFLTDLEAADQPCNQLIDAFDTVASQINVARVITSWIIDQSLHVLSDSMRYPSYDRINNDHLNFRSIT